MTIDHFPPALNSINETLDVEVVISCNVHVIRLPMKLRNSDNCNQIKSHIRLLINAPKNMTMFRNMVQVIKRKWHIMGEKSYSDHMSKCYFVKEWGNWCTCSTMRPGFGAENNPIEGCNYSGKCLIHTCIMFY